MSEMFRREYRVETRRTAGHPGGEGHWCPEGDHRTFPERGQAEAFLDIRARWYANPRYFEHRITSRAISDWMPVVPIVEGPK